MKWFYHHKGREKGKKKRSVTTMNGMTRPHTLIPTKTGVLKRYEKFCLQLSI